MPPINIGAKPRIPGSLLAPKSAAPRPLQSPANQKITLHDGRTLGFAEFGAPKGFPLLYFHGFPSSRLEGSGVESIARKKGLRIIAPDRPGYGLSTFQPARRIPDWPGDVQTLVDHLGLSRFAVLGGSGGGPYALACAHLLPREKLVGLGVLAGAGPWEAGLQHVSLPRRLISLMARRIPGLLEVGLDGTIGALRWAVSTKPVIRWVENWLEQQEPSDKSGLPIEERRQMVLTMMFEAFTQGSAATVQEAVLLSQNWGFNLQDVRYDKIRIWHGEKDANAPIEMIRYMAEKLPHAVLKVYEGETHYTVSRHLEDILDELVHEKMREYAPA
ncbi:Alpha/Beta hydrolase protein [Aspergillus crustosus]